MATRQTVIWGRGNLAIWEIFQTVANQFCYDFHQSPTTVMAAYGIPRAARPRLLRQLAMIYDIQRRNQEKSRGD